MATARFQDDFGAAAHLEVGGTRYRIFSLAKVAERAPRIARYPYSIRILIENALRNLDGRLVERAHVERLLAWEDPTRQGAVEIPFTPSRVVLQDFTGVPVLVDLAAMRDAAARLGADPDRINPLIPVDLVIDHSVQVDEFGNRAAVIANVEREYERNAERYAFLRWGQRALRNVRVVPPSTGIVHQVNLEYLASVVDARDRDGERLAFPDTLLGTDSHTTMINGLGVLGWGVGGIEAEAAMLGHPMMMLMPAVVGFRLTGRLAEGTTATDLVLTVTQRLRAHGVVGKFVEFFGNGLAGLSLADRATIANMCPEYGATVGFFPADAETIEYLKFTGRPADRIALVEAYLKAQGLFRTDDSPDPVYSETIELDLATVEPSLAGPKRPQDRVALADLKDSFAKALVASPKERGFGLSGDALKTTVAVRTNGSTSTLTHGAVVIAAITSCTNTSNPSVMIAAGLLARKAVERGLRVPSHVKTSLAPGSRVVTDYLAKAGLMEPLETLRFHLVGYGCTTCIGNSGPLPEPVAKAVREGNLVAAAVLSGNRNFEGRISPDVKANYLASPPLVVAYALAGRVNVDLSTEPLGTAKNGAPVYLRDLWPTLREIADTIRACLDPSMFTKRYAEVFDGDERWRALPSPEGGRYAWNPDSTYIQPAPYFDEMTRTPSPVGDLRGLRVLVRLGDSVTTDHISPAGSIKPDSPAGRYLQDRGVQPKDFNSYGSRRGNHEVMIRGTFANVRLRNLLAPGTEGGVTLNFLTGRIEPIYDASLAYRRAGIPLLVIAGKEYGSGSSRDWAAKGTALLGVRAVLAESYERIHRSNLVEMGVLPLEFPRGRNAESLGLDGTETYDVEGLAGDLRPGMTVSVKAFRRNGPPIVFEAQARLDTRADVEYYRHGGILPAVLRQMLG